MAAKALGWYTFILDGGFLQKVSAFYHFFIIFLFPLLDLPIVPNLYASVQGVIAGKAGRFDRSNQVFVYFVCRLTASMNLGRARIRLNRVGWIIRR